VWRQIHVCHEIGWVIAIGAGRLGCYGHAGWCYRQTEDRHRPLCVHMDGWIDGWIGGCVSFIGIGVCVSTVVLANYPGWAAWVLCAMRCVAYLLPACLPA